MLAGLPGRTGAVCAGPVGNAFGRSEARGPGRVSAAAAHLNDDVRASTDLSLAAYHAEKDVGATRAGRSRFSMRSRCRQWEEVNVENITWE